MNNIVCALQIKSLELSVQLGWTHAEQLEPQNVWLDVLLQLPKPPLACVSDELQDTFCYDSLIQAIRKHIAGKRYRLVERLAADIFQCVKSFLAQDIKVTLILKKLPLITGLKEGVCFSYSEE